MAVNNACGGSCWQLVNGSKLVIFQETYDVKAVTKQYCNDSCRILVCNANNNLTAIPAL